MIHEVDEALRALVRRDALNGSDVEVVFDAPTKDWAGRRNTPTLDVYLYDIREDMKRRHVGMVEDRDDTGTVVGRRPPPRQFKLSYLITAWTNRPEDEHRLLSSALGCFIRYDTLPDDVLTGSLADVGIPVSMYVALPPPEDRQISDVWSALGGELKPSLDLVVVAPVDTARALPFGPPVLEQPRITVTRDDGATETKTSRRHPAVVTEPAAPPPEEQVVSGTEEQPGRVFRMRGTSRR
jgi:hypothetical protein